MWIVQLFWCSAPSAAPAPASTTKQWSGAQLNLKAPVGDTLWTDTVGRKSGYTQLGMLYVARPMCSPEVFRAAEHRFNVWGGQVEAERSTLTAAFAMGEYERTCGEAEITRGGADH